jgi:purine-nucleoside phosphorylase
MSSDRPFDLIPAADALRERLGGLRPRVFVVLGSGLGGLAGAIPDPVSIPFTDLPGLHDPGVEGHAGHFLAGELDGVGVLLQSGRYHLYEGHSPSLVAAPVRIAAMLGAETLLVTNAAGGIRKSLEPGALMVIEDHINFQGRNPLVGRKLEGEPRFPDMTEAYDRDLMGQAESVAAALQVPLTRGVYAAVLGPSYETPAEIRMLSALGADAVGMSTVPEVIAARARGMRVLGFSLITNLAAGLSGQPLSHREVVEVGARSAVSLQRVVEGVIRRLD